MAEYYVCSKGDEYIGWMDACMVWWRAEGKGYTYDLNAAGIFTDENKERNYPDGRTSHYIPRDLVDANSYSPRLAWWSATRTDTTLPIREAIAQAKADS